MHPRAVRRATDRPRCAQPTPTTSACGDIKVRVATAHRLLTATLPTPCVRWRLARGRPSEAEAIVDGITRAWRAGPDHVSPATRESAARQIFGEWSAKARSPSVIERLGTPASTELSRRTPVLWLSF
jgi:hypothetical protein